MEQGVISIPMRIIDFCLLTLLCLSSSCVQTEDRKQKAESTKIETSKIGLPVVSASTILADFNSFWSYYTKHVELYEDFTAFDAEGETITKEDFLKQLNSGLYFPLVLNSKYPALNYKLYKIPSEADPHISNYMRQFSKNQLIFYKMEGKKIPSFSFSDVNGKVYTSENTKGKIVLFKCWFIGCVACVKEMPALNELVKKYKGRGDILFISLAIDSKEELQGFLRKTKFDYATVPNQEEYMSEKLNLWGYPTHYLIDKNGILIRVLPNDTQVAEALEKELAK